MKPFHLQVQLVPESKKLNLQWFGQSAIRAGGSRTLLRRADAQAAPVIRDVREAIETGRRARDREIPRAFGDHFAIDVRQDREGSGGE